MPRFGIRGHNSKFTKKGKGGNKPKKPSDTKGNWAYSFYQKGKRGECEMEQKIKSQTPASNFDHSKIPDLMEPRLSKVEQIYQKFKKGSTLNKSDQIILDNYMNKEKKQIKADCESIENHGLNANVSSTEGRIRKLLLVAKRQIDNNDPVMAYYVHQKLEEFDIPQNIRDEFADLFGQMLEIVSQQNRIELQFTTFSSNMPPLNNKGFTQLDEFQKQVITGINNATSLIVQAPTSSGKSILSGHVFSKYSKVIVVVPTDILCWQMATMIGKITGKDIPIVTKTFQSSPKRDELIEKVKLTQIIVGTPRELMDYLPWFSDIQFEYMIIDEIHMMGKADCAEMETIAKLYADIPVLALSATIGNVEKLQEWFCSIGHKTIKVIKCNKRFFNLRNYYYKDCAIHPIHPLSMVGCEDIKQILTKNLTPTPPDIWELALTLKKNFHMGRLDPYKYFTQDQRIILDQANQYFRELLEFIIAKYPLAEKKVNDIINKYKPTDLVAEEVDLTKLAFTMKDEKKLPGIIFQTNAYKCLEMVKEFSCSIKEKEQKAHPGLYKERLKQQKVAKHMEKKKDKEKIDDMGDKKRTKAMMEGKLEQFEEAIPVSLFEPHPDFIVTPNQYITQYEIEDTGRQLKKYFPNNGIEYHYIIDLLWRGIGVYVKGLPEPYLRIVQTKACAGKLGIVFSDDSLVFGVSMPFRSTIITPDENLDSMMFHQMAGRAGRRGLDKEGNVVFVGQSWDRIKTLSISAIPDVIGCDTMLYGQVFGERLGKHSRWEKLGQNFLLKAITSTYATEFYQDITDNIKEGSAWDYVNSTDKNFLHMMWRFRHTDDCFRIPILCNYIKKIFRNSNPVNQNTQIELAKFMCQFLEYEIVDETSPKCMSPVESAKKYDIHTYLEQLQLDTSRYVDSKLYNIIRMNTIMTLEKNERHELRERLMKFSEKLIIIQHYFFHSKEIDITRLMSKLITRCWWIYHSSSPIIE